MRSDEADHRRADLILQPGNTLVQLKSRSLVDERTVDQLADLLPDPHVLIVVIADRVTAAARKQLADHGIGYFDLRGHLALRTEHIIIDTEIDRPRHPQSKRKLFAGKAGLEVAVALLREPRGGASVRALARSIGRSPSTVSAELRAFQQEELVDAQNRVNDDQLFWRLAEAWPSTSTYLKTAPPAGDGPVGRSLGLHPRELDLRGWSLTGDRAAIAWGAPVATKDNSLLDFYVPSAQYLQRATTLLGEARSPADAICAIRLAPVSAVIDDRRRSDAVATEGWPVCAPLFVALDLAQDRGRGREILREWTPDEPWHRVW